MALALARLGSGLAASEVHYYASKQNNGSGAMINVPSREAAERLWNQEATKTDSAGPEGVYLAVLLNSDGRLVHGWSFRGDQEQVESLANEVRRTFGLPGLPPPRPRWLVPTVVIGGGLLVAAGALVYVLRQRR